MGSLLAALNRHEEALTFQRRYVQLAEQLSRMAPGEQFARDRLQNAHWHLGQTLVALGRTEEALNDHLLPYATKWLELPIDSEISSDDAQRAHIARMLIATALSNLSRPSEALAHVFYAS